MLPRPLHSVVVALALAAMQIPNDPVPPPLPPAPPRQPPANALGYDPVIPPSDDPWELRSTLLEPLAHKAEGYAQYAVKFICDETVRLAEYKGGGSGEVDKEKTHRYAY